MGKPQKPRPPKKTEAQQTKEYIEFLERRVRSKNYKAKATPEEYEKTQEQLKKARFRLRIMEK